MHSRVSTVTDENQLSLGLRGFCYRAVLYPLTILVCNVTGILKLQTSLIFELYLATIYKLFPQWRKFYQLSLIERASFVRKKVIVQASLTNWICFLTIIW